MIPEDVYNALAAALVRARPYVISVIQIERARVELGEAVGVNLAQMEADLAKIDAVLDREGGVPRGTTEDIE